MIIVIAEETAPKLFKELFENQHNFTVMTNHLLSFNKRMRIDKNIPMGALLCGDRLIVDENCWKSFQEMCVDVGIILDFTNLYHQTDNNDSL